MLLRKRRLAVDVIRASAIVLGLVTIGCGEGASVEPETPGTHWIVAVDLSASLNANQLQESRQFLLGLSQVVKNGDAVTVFRVYERGLADSNYMWQTEVAPAPDRDHPRASDSLALVDFKDELTAEVDVIFDPSLQGTLLGTDLFSTAHRAADLAKSDPSRKKVLLFVSDMLHSTRALDMEKTVPDSSWVGTAMKDNALPELDGVCVGVVGANPTTSRGLKARAFWSSYFRSARAHLPPENYRNFAQSPEGMTCEHADARS